MPATQPGARYARTCGGLIRTCTGSALPWAVPRVRFPLPISVKGGVVEEPECPVEGKVS